MWLVYLGAYFLRIVSGRVNLLRSSGMEFRSRETLNVKGFLVARPLCSLGRGTVTICCLVARKFVFGSYQLTHVDVIGVQVGCILLEEGLLLCFEGPRRYLRCMYSPFTLTNTHNRHLDDPTACQVLLHFTHNICPRFIILSYTIITT